MTENPRCVKCGAVGILDCSGEIAEWAVTGAMDPYCDHEAETPDLPIPEAAVREGGWIIAEHRSQAWLTYSDDARASLARSWEPTARAVLAAALPHLRSPGRDPGGVRESTRTRGSIR